MLRNVPAEFVDSETALGCLLTTRKIDVSFLHELDGFRLDEIVGVVERELGRDARRTLAARLVVAVIAERSTHELHQTFFGGDERRHFLPLFCSLSDLARHALVVRAVVVVKWVTNPALALV